MKLWQSMEVGIKAVRVQIGNACCLKIELHHLGRLPLFQKRKQRVSIVELTDPFPNEWNEIGVQREHEGIGEIRAVECVNFKGPIPYPADGLPGEPIPEGVGWDLWQGQAPVHPFNHELFQLWSVKKVGHRTASICHLIVITRLLGRRLKWDPEKEVFSGDEQAGFLLDRPRRKGSELPEFG